MWQQCSMLNAAADVSASEPDSTMAAEEDLLLDNTAPGNPAPLHT